MAFVPWLTHYDREKKDLEQSRQIKHLTFDLYLKSCIKKFKTIQAERYRIELATVRAEIEWVLQGRPYYNFHTNLLEPALRMKLNKIPINLIEAPRDFSAVNLRFQEDQNLPTMLIATGEKGNCCIYCCHEDNLAVTGLPSDSTEDAESYIRRTCNEAATREGLNNIEINRMQSVLEKAIRLYIITKFLADTPNDDLIEFDIASKYRAEWEGASPRRREEIIEASKKKGKLGWNIGVKEKLIMNAPRLSPTDEHSSEQSKELTHAHIRTGHLHCVRCGPNKRDVKVMFFRPTVVRGDLPFRE